MGQSVSKIIKVILSLRVGTSKNKNIDHWDRETSDNESYLISLLCDSTISRALNFCFLCTLLQPKGKVNSKKENVYMWNQFHYFFDLPKIRVGWAHATKNEVAFVLHPSHVISQEQYGIWSWFLVLLCKMMITPGFFWLFWNFHFSLLLRG